MGRELPIRTENIAGAGRAGGPPGVGTEASRNRAHAGVAETRDNGAAVRAAGTEHIAVFVVRQWLHLELRIGTDGVARPRNGKVRLGRIITPPVPHRAAAPGRIPSAALVIAADAEAFGEHNC